jgi:hypothetical protein
MSVSAYLPSSSLWLAPKSDTRCNCRRRSAIIARSALAGDRAYGFPRPRGTARIREWSRRWASGRSIRRGCLDNRPLESWNKVPPAEFVNANPVSRHNYRAAVNVYDSRACLCLIKARGSRRLPASRVCLRNVVCHRSLNFAISGFYKLL